jgi:hypothetical protein
MRGELDDALARMARREQLQRRVAEQAAGGPVDEVVEAVRRVVAQHPALAVRLWVEDGSVPSLVRVAWSEGAVTVTPETIAAPADSGATPSWPMSVRTVPAWAAAADGLTDAPAARLAEMIRRDPSLLDGTDNGG